MKKLGVLIITVLIGAVVVWGGYSFLKNSKNLEEESIKLGVILPLSGGSGVDQGEWVKQGIELAFNEMNNKNIELMYEDSQGDPKIAISAYKSLRTRYNTPVVFTWGSSIGLALSPIINQDKVVQMGVATAVPSYTSPDDFNFRNFPSASLESEYLAQTLLEDLNVSNSAIIKLNNDYGIGAAESFKKQYQLKGGNIVIEETVQPNATDFRAQLTKIKNANPEFIYIASYPKEGGLLVKQAREVGIKSQFIASLAILGGKEFFDIAGESAEGLIVVTSSPVFAGNNDPEVKRFVNSYEEHYQETPGPQHQYAARAYDAFKIVYSAVQQCSSDTECIKQKLFTVKNYKGAGGEISFDQNGDIISDFHLQVVKNGKFVSY